MSEPVSAESRKVIDTCIFFNELDTLELRLKQLENVVDFFVIVESREAFSGVVKPLVFESHKPRFEKYLNRIHHVILPGLPPLREDTEAARFWLEAFQRNAIMLGLIGRRLDANDIILISDADEIPKPEAIERAANDIEDNDVIVFKQQLYKFFLDAKIPKEEKRWLGTIAIKYKTLGKHLPDSLRRIARAGRYYEAAIEAMPQEGGIKRRFLEGGGWHMSYFGGQEAVRYKVANFAHGARSHPGDAQKVSPAVIARGELQKLRLFDDKLKKELGNCLAELQGDVPEPVLEDLEQYYHLFGRAAM